MNKWKVAALVLGGVLVGSWTGAPQTTSATGHSSFKECAALCGRRGATMKASKLDESTIEIPEGWTVLGSAGGGELPCAFLCR